ncbi:MAG: hypothetical protein HRT37_19535 [Alteromonadaceae bacterium]|nr:hypothetical protein [Alteromonadaceae bacterium]
MKKTIAMLVVTITSMSASASYMYGTVTELAITHDSATFQIDTSNGYNGQDVCDTSKELNFKIDFTKPGGIALFDIIKESRKAQTNVGVNGTGICINNEFEMVDRIAPAMPVTP